MVVKKLNTQPLDRVDISVIVPVYNVENYLSTCLDSIFCQVLPAGKRMEVLAVNDGSTDGSADILSTYERKHPCLRVITQANQGLSGARNTGIQAATGDYLMFVDSDDCLAPNAFVECLQMALETGADILYFDCQHIDAAGRPGRVFTNDKEGIAAGELFDPTERPQVLSILPSAWSKFYRRSFIQENSLFFKPGIWFEDIHFYLRLIPERPRMAYLPGALYLYRQHGASITKSFADERNRAIITVFEDLLPFYRQREDYEAYRKELDFLGLDNIYTGIMYTLARGRNKSLFQEVEHFYRQNFPLVDRAVHRGIRRRLSFRKRILAGLADLHLLWPAGKVANLKNKAGAGC